MNIRLHGTQAECGKAARDDRHCLAYLGISTSQSEMRWAEVPAMASFTMRRRMGAQTGSG
jgi:hypothetical protein